MKNIHLIPTSKPSRLHLAYNKNYYLSIEPFVQLDTKNYKSFNIYITSDEEINQQTKPCCCINTIKNTWDDDLIYYQGSMPQYHYKGFKKIILSTDQELIEYGIQPIDDTFLEWFVKNPSCEEVKTRKIGEEWIYNADVPKEPKQTDENGKPLTYWGGLEEPIQETIEEAADSYSSNPIFRIGTPRQDIKRGFELGAKWQAERMYSEEDMTNYAMFILLNKLITPKEWFEQFKKK